MERFWFSLMVALVEMVEITIKLLSWPNFVGWNSNVLHIPFNHPTSLLNQVNVKWFSLQTFHLLFKNKHSLKSEDACDVRHHWQMLHVSQKGETKVSSVTFAIMKNMAWNKWTKASIFLVSIVHCFSRHSGGTEFWCICIVYLTKKWYNLNTKKNGHGVWKHAIYLPTLARRLTHLGIEFPVSL